MTKDKFGQAQTYYPQLAKVTGGVTAAILLVYLIDQETENWWRYDEKEIENYTGLTAPEQATARDRLVQRGFLQMRLLAHSQTECCLNLTVLEQKLAAFSRLIFSASPTPTPPPVSDPYFGQRRQPIAVPVTPHYQFQGPWTSREQFEAFQRALLAYFTAQGKPNPSGYMFKVIDGMTKGMISPFWDDFVQGVPLGSSQQIQQDWEVEPGVPYPAFAEERTQYYIHKGEPLEAAVARARADLRNPVLAKDLWDGFLRKCDRLAQDAKRHQEQGVQNPYLPPSFGSRSQPQKDEVGDRLNQINPPTDALPPSAETPEQPEKPSLQILQTLCRNALGRNIVAKQLAEHPEWGYRLEGDRVVDVQR